eukprot:8232675-Ditylum_brightwellii.AAC.1
MGGGDTDDEISSYIVFLAGLALSKDGNVGEEGEECGKDGDTCLSSDVFFDESVIVGEEGGDDT